MIGGVAHAGVVGRKPQVGDVTIDQDLLHAVPAVVAVINAFFRPQQDDVGIGGMEADAAGVGGFQALGRADDVPGRAPVLGAVEAAEVAGGQDHAIRPSFDDVEPAACAGIGALPGGSGRGRGREAVGGNGAGLGGRGAGGYHQGHHGNDREKENRLQKGLGVVGTDKHLAAQWLCGMRWSKRKISGLLDGQPGSVIPGWVQQPRNPLTGVRDLQTLDAVG